MYITSTERDAKTVTDVERLLDEHGAGISSKKIQGWFTVTIDLPRTPFAAAQHVVMRGETFRDAFNAAYDQLKFGE